MSKRTETSSAKTNPSDFWPTPPSAVLPLVPHLTLDTLKNAFIEPCAGDGALVDALVAQGLECVLASDIAPRHTSIIQKDAAKMRLVSAIYPIVTNPPWARPLLEPILANLVGKAPVWLLLPLDMAANLWTNPYMRHVNKIVPLGRVSWLGNGKAGMENSMWARFDIKRQDFITERKAK